MRPLLCSDDRRRLLLLARAALAEVVLYNRIPEIPEAGGRLAERGGAFVTLHYRGKLRGCVGMSGAELSLSETVVQAAIGAARHDPRFTAVTPEELPTWKSRFQFFLSRSRLRPRRLKSAVTACS